MTTSSSSPKGSSLLGHETKAPAMQLKLLSASVLNIDGNAFPGSTIRKRCNGVGDSDARTHHGAVGFASKAGSELSAIEIYAEKKGVAHVSHK